MNQTGILFFLHGFLGDPRDWEGVIHYLRSYRCVALEYPFLTPSSEGVLIGYSMGGRIALRDPRPKILISTHPGLKKEQIASRLVVEIEWLEKLQNLSFAQFVQEWYNQPLFLSFKNNPCFKAVLERRFLNDPLKVKKMIQEESITIPRKTFLNHSQFIYGEFDTKFQQVYDEFQIPALVIPGVGHACHLENPEKCAYAIKQALARLKSASLQF